MLNRINRIAWKRDVTRFFGQKAVERYPFGRTNHHGRWQLVVIGLPSWLARPTKPVGQRREEGTFKTFELQTDPLKMSHSLDSLSRLMQTLHERAKTQPEGSYTTKLLQAGPEKIGGKILEEATELIEAATEPGEEGRDHFVYEAGDVLYHTLVMLAWRGVDLADVAAELARREGTSGLVEKANRQKTEP